MAINPRLQAIIDAARIKTATMRAEAEARRNNVSPEDVSKGMEVTSPQVTLSGDPQSVQPSTIQNNTIETISGQSFDPFSFEKNGQIIVLNEQQRKAVQWFGVEGKSGCLIGPAGSGKTTTMQAIINAAVKCGRIPIIPTDDTHKYIPTNVPGIWGGSFTRIATRNLRDNTPVDLKGNIHTIHRLLEYEPEIRDVDKLDEHGKPTGETKQIKVFVPTRNRMRKLSSSLKMFVIDEASMPGMQLHQNLLNAIGAKDAQILYIGDIAQLPPVMDESVFGYKLLELPVVELTEIYRHAGRIVNLANHIRTGNTIPDAKKIFQWSTNLSLLRKNKEAKKIVEEGVAEWNGEEDGSKVTIHLWKNRLDGEIGQLQALQSLGGYDYKRGVGGFFPEEIKAGRYDPLEHMILIPYNKNVGTVELNKYIADFLGKARGATVHEVIAGYNKHYLAVGDKVFYDREEAIITKINKNAQYAGKVPQPSSVTLDRWGHNQAGIAETMDQDEFDSIDNLLKNIVDLGEDEERKNQASHVVYVKKIRDMEDGKDHGDYEETNSGTDLRTASEINSLLGGYALTIHKSQGSQWPKVYCVFHNSHNRNLQRELLYTAITRAQKELYVIAEPETFIQGVTSQHIIGNTLEQKAEYFKGKVKAQKNRDSLFNPPQDEKE